MVKIVICGICGRMASRVNALAKQDSEIKVVGGVERKSHPYVGKEIDGVKISSSLDEIIGSGDVVVEFTTPEATIEHFEIARTNKKPIVIGTTGFNEEQKRRIKEGSNEIPVVLSSNMSLGVNVLFKLVEEIAKALPDYDTEIIEVHHSKKKDAPSGTAMRIAEIIAANSKNKRYVYGRKGDVGPRGRDEMGIFALRGGGVVGEHIVMFIGENERIELIHRSQSRDVFAIGALKAAKWIKDRSPGLYDMLDVLELK